ncbi:MAG: DUF559 domain-containing protein [Abitibacteriaceae bacterium]|nr:DUF559 domain-containing protein [Abditibacteriaceae bacterium]
MLNRTESPHHLTIHAKSLRQTSTSAESMLWQKLRAKQVLGLRFRRQEPIGLYITDFFCSATRLIIELDGYSHEDKKDNDIERQSYLEQQGFMVLRFLNEEIYHNLNGVLETIEVHCIERLTHTPTQPPPREKE